MSDLKAEAFFTSKVAGLACNPVEFLTITYLVTIINTSLLLFVI